MCKNLIVLRDDQGFQFAGIECFEVGKNTSSAIHCLEYAALFLQHDENAQEKNKIFCSHRHLRIVAAHRTPPIDPFKKHG